MSRSFALLVSDMRDGPRRPDASPSVSRTIRSLASGGAGAERPDGFQDRRHRGRFVARAGSADDRIGMGRQQHRLAPGPRPGEDGDRVLARDPLVRLRADLRAERAQLGGEVSPDAGRLGRSQRAGPGGSWSMTARVARAAAVAARINSIRRGGLLCPRSRREEGDGARSRRRGSSEYTARRSARHLARSTARVDRPARPLGAISGRFSDRLLARFG